jgi:hypothetical protein
MKGMKRQSKILLIAGCQRSGTSLLASMMGRHSEINMLFESTTDDVKRLMGKVYSANKLSLQRHIRIDQRASRWGYFVIRLVNWDWGFGEGRKYHTKRPYPGSKLSIKDYEAMDATFITIEREKESAVNSIVNRTPMNQKQASREWDKSREIVEYLNKRGAFAVQFQDLVSEPEKVMKEICSYLDLQYEERMLDGPKFNHVYPQKGIRKDVKG